MEILLAHLFGDYVFQSNWMAKNKSSKTIPALVHALVYTLCYLALYSIIPMSLIGYMFIGITHFAIDRWKLASYWTRFIGIGVPSIFDKTGEAGPAFMTVWLGIIVDNAFHLLINWAALRLFGA